MASLFLEIQTDDEWRQQIHEVSYHELEIWNFVSSGQANCTWEKTLTSL